VSATGARCPLCGGGSEHALHARDRNRGLGDGRFAYRRCESCETLFIEEIPQDLGDYYVSAGYGSLQDAPDPRLQAGERFKLALLRGYLPGRELIEIGPGAGNFARVAVEAGLHVTAVEMDERYCRELEQQLGVRAIPSATPARALEDLAPADGIAMWHSIEHLPEVAEVLGSAVRRLVPGGVLAFSTPNPDALQFRVLRGTWAHLDAPRHLQLLPAPAMRRHLEALGMEHLETITDDPIGLACNRLGWDYAARIHPARYRAHVLTNAVTASTGVVLTRLLAPLERRGLAGSTYTSFYRRAPAER
jgi:2-polyprenyl-3-methyl-5-hydroxy-6-metoxy-1,4-benzoquinol methylase